MKEKLKNEILLMLNTCVDTSTLQMIDHKLDVILADYEVGSRKLRLFHMNINFMKHSRFT